MNLCAKGPQFITWWGGIAPGDVVEILPNTGGAPWSYTSGAATLNIDAAVGTPNQKITVRGKGGANIVGGVNILNSHHLQVMNLEVTEPRPGGNGLSIQGGSSNITVKNSTIRDSAVNGISIVSTAGPYIQIGPGNLVTNNSGNGIAVGARGFDSGLGVPSITSQIQANTVSGNGIHGIDVEASYWRILSNTVTGNGRLTGGTSGVHLFSNVSSGQLDCDGNEVVYNYVSKQRDSTMADGNGIQIDHFCDSNLVGYNVAWSNAGSGISLYIGSFNRILANTVLDNNKDIGRSARLPGVVIAEMTLTGGTVWCADQQPGTNVCNRWEPIPSDRTSGNVIGDNIVHSTKSAVPAVLANSDFVNISNSNVMLENWLYNDYLALASPSSAQVLNWAGVLYASPESIDSATGLGYAGNLVGPPSYWNSTSPGKGADGLRLTVKPPKLGWKITPKRPDIIGVMPTAGSSYFGAYYTN